MELVGQGGKRNGAGRPRSAPSMVLRLPVPIADWARRLAPRPLPAGAERIRLVEARTTAEVPWFSSRVPCGFPSPADDYVERPLDFNEYLITRPASTFVFTVDGESMIGVGLYPNDLIIVDKSITPTNGCIVLAVVENEFTIKTYCVKGSIVVLRPENPDFTDIVINPEIGFEVWGVVTNSIRAHLPR